MTQAFLFGFLVYLFVFVFVLSFVHLHEPMMTSLGTLKSSTSSVCSYVKKKKEKKKKKGVCNIQLLK